MIASAQPFHESIQHRLESISMRLDAATDNLLHTRDTLIQNMEHQMLQLHEVRSALHEAAKMVTQWAAVEAPAAQPSSIKPVGELTMEQLFSPLNSVPRNAPTARTEVIQPPVYEPEVLFDEAPSNAWETVAEEVFHPFSSQSRNAAVSTLEPEALATLHKTEIDPALEKATLDELNDALSRAFSQMANRQGSR